MSEEFKTIVWFHRVITTDELRMISLPAQFQLSILLHPTALQVQEDQGPRSSSCHQDSKVWHQATWDAPAMPPTSLLCFAAHPKEGSDQTPVFSTAGMGFGQAGLQTINSSDLL